MPATASSRSVRQPALTLSFLMLAGLLNYLDRSSLSVANPVIRAELHLSATQMGGLLAAFSLAYGIGQIPAGALVKRFRFRTVLGASMLVWSAAQMLTGFIRSNGVFQALRGLLGLGESPFFPASLDAVRSGFEPQHRGRVMGLVNTSTILGQALAPPVLTLLMLRVGWRGMSCTIGAIGMLLATLWLIFGRGKPLPADPAEAPQPPFSLALLFADPTLLALLRSRTMIGMMLGFGGVNYTAWLYLTWLPGYLAAQYHLNLKATGALSSIPFIAGAIGMIASGLLTDLRKPTPQQAIGWQRLLIAIGMLCSAAGTALVAHVTTIPGAVAAISIALFFIHFAGTAAWNLIHVTTPSPLVAQVCSLQNLGSYLIASAAPLLTGWLLDRTHSFHIALLLCSLVTSAGAAAYIFLATKPITLPAKA